MTSYLSPKDVLGRSGDKACLAHKDPGLIPSLSKENMMAHVWNSALRRWKQEEQKCRVILCLGYIRFCLQNIVKTLGRRRY